MPEELDLSDNDIQRLAARFKILSEPSRLKIIRSLFSGEKNVSAIIEITGLLQANVSKQLKILVDSAILDCRRDGLNRIYYIIDPKVREICKLLCHD